MTKIYIPFSKELYDDIIRFSDGRLDPIQLANELVADWVGRMSFHTDYWSTHWEKVAEKYAPTEYDRWKTKERKEWEKLEKERENLVWKEISIKSGSDVRMKYKGNIYYAKVKGGKIVDEDGEFTPSQWAYKIAGGTARNAWRDLWFREPHSSLWIQAQTLRTQVRNSNARQGRNKK